ncbi:MAG: DUF5916 domain-containing protein [Ignavibacteriales bacterium]|nr:DUF5916 domain-containing protein [Ignavibacteriales bacterium]
MIFLRILIHFTSPGAPAFLMILARTMSILLLVFPLLESPSFGQNKATSARAVNAVRTTGPIKIDGRLTEPAWQRKGETGFVQRTPDENSPASQKTEVLVAYDQNALYVAVKMFDTHPDSIVGRLARRDQDSQSDLVIIGIDAAHDKRTGYYFGVNPAGAIQDGTLSNDTQTDDGWDGVWDAGVRIESWGWTAEFRIPYSQLRFPKRDKYVWGFEVYRFIQRRNEESYLVYYPRTDRLRVSRWIELQGIEGIKPPLRIELLPYAAATGKFLQQPPVDVFNAGRTDPFKVQRDFPLSLGADAKIGLAGDVTLDLSLNPDFGQVEVDPAVVNLTAYEIYYQEKRPFFIEGSNIMSFGRGGAASLQDFYWTDPSFFYSRRIGRAPQGSVTHRGFQDIPDRTTILGAAKLSGKITNSWSFAALTAVTDREYGEVDSAGVRFKEEVEPRTLYGVVRTQKEFNDARQAIGMVGTIVEREVGDQRLAGVVNNGAASLGLDGWTFIDREKVWVLTGWAGASYVSGSKDRLIDLQRSPQHFFQRPDASYLSVDPNATSLTGWASRVWLDKVTGNWIFNAAIGAINPKFETNDVGFLTRADFLNGHVYVGYQWFQPDRLFRTKTITGAVIQQFDFGGNKIGDSYQISLDGQFLNYWEAALAVGLNGETYDDQRTRGGPLMRQLSSQSLVFTLWSDTRKPFYGTLNTTVSKGRSGAWTLNPSLSINWKATRTLNASLNLDFSRVHSEAQYITTIDDPMSFKTFGSRYVFGTLDQKQLSTTIRLNWTFTPKLSLQFYVQPLLSTGAYAGIKELAQPGTFTFNRYGEGYSQIRLIGNTYFVDPNGPLGPALPFRFSMPDFNYKSIRVNAVFRWEYLPGSTLYFVWTHEKADYESRGDFEFGRDVIRLARVAPDNVYSIKITYWLNP